MDQGQLQKEVEEILEDVLAKASLHEGALFVLGLSSSEVIGGHIGKASSQEIGELTTLLHLNAWTTKLKRPKSINKSLVVITVQWNSILNYNM